MTVASPVVNSPILAHRGASAFAPENTLRAIEVAAERGATWIETDVRLTLDGQLVMIHDETLSRTTNGSGFVSEHTLAQIRTLDAGAWFGPEFKGLQVPTLVEYLACIQDLGLSLQLELKPMRGREEELAVAVADTLESVWNFDGAASKLFLASSAERSLSVLAKRLPKVPRALALHYLPHDPERLAREVGVQILHVKDSFLTAEALERIARSPLEIAVATVNSRDRAQFLIGRGVQSVITDNPNLLTPGAERGPESDAHVRSLIPFMEEIAQHAGNIAMQYQKDPLALKTEEKSWFDFVTAADKGAEEAIVAAIKAQYPEDSILSEEGTRENGGRGRLWVIDPIDGTTNFIRSLPWWGVSMGLLENGRPVAGVIHAPALNITMSAVVGEGAWLNGEPYALEIAEVASEPPVVMSGVSPKMAAAGDAEKLSFLIRTHLRGIERRLGCGTASLLQVLLGKASLYFGLGERIWDVCAASIIAEELGLRHSIDRTKTVDDEPFNFVCGVPRLFDQAVKGFSSRHELR